MGENKFAESEGSEICNRIGFIKENGEVFIYNFKIIRFVLSLQIYKKIIKNQ